MSEKEAKKHKGTLFYTLLFVCLGIWGYVFYRIAHGVGETENAFDVAPMVPTLRPVPEAAPRRSEPRGNYAGDFRDPFARPSRLFTPSRAEPPGRQARSLAVGAPPLVLAGVVDQTALLQGKDGSVFVARAGEQAGTVQVLTVAADQVVVRFEGRSHTLHLTL